MQNHLSRWKFAKEHVQKTILRVVHQRLACFQMWTMFMGIKFFVRFRGVKNRLFWSEFGKENFRKKVRFEFAKEFLTWICEGMIFSESWSRFVFGNVQLTPTCYQKWFVDSLKQLHQIFKRTPKINSNFFTVILPRERSFHKKIFFSELT